ncbi:hypothetical protein [Streptomyces jeddahensis]|uniref:Uncharacterized protein n=1 Tax=Streptomyces jeddahensis TaxID=1716141 RepID=A0A177HFH5_9ACTN|nr:hypothetical protein [Streptomyces jeddahensis]OAH09725.1 hypothetical protein STSP_68980 [Streptomyces jeddahensis]
MAGLGFVALGVVLIAAGALWKGRAIRPLFRKRARAALARDYRRQLLRSADMAIAAARRRAARGEPVIVRIDDVIGIASQHFGHDVVPREQAAAALRQRYEAGGCRRDCMTDAFD